MTTLVLGASRLRPRWYREILLIVALYVLYAAGRSVVPTDPSGALDNGRALLELQEQIGLAPEQAMNQWLLALPALGIAADYFYATLHYLVTPGVLLWLYLRHPDNYIGARRVLVTATTIGLFCFWLLPTAPPRMLHGFVDTMAYWQHWGWWGNAASAPEGLAEFSNQFAAMPSLHVGWALWSGWMIARCGRRTIVKVAGVLYPILTVLVVMATANHYLLDAIAGAALVIVAGLPLLVRGAQVRADRSAAATG